jgi:hypothetical protein
MGRGTGNLAGLAGGVQYCRASIKVLADSEWGNQGIFQTYSKSQKKMAKLASTESSIYTSNNKDNSELRI